MKSPRFRDSERFRLPYETAEKSKQPGYLAQRMRIYTEMVAKEQADKRLRLHVVKEER